MTLEVVVETLIKAVIVIGALLTGFAYLTLFERKVQARMQQRPGPNRVGPWGLLQPAADGLKLFFKSSSAPSGRSRMAAPTASPHPIHGLSDESCNLSSPTIAKSSASAVKNTSHVSVSAFAT